MERFAKVQDLPGFVKDTTNGAILNTDEAALEAYKKRKNREAHIDNKIINIESKVDKIDNDLNEIKGLLQILIKKI